MTPSDGLWSEENGNLGAGMREIDRLVIEAAYVCFEAGDLAALLCHFDDEVEFAVNSHGSATILGSGCGRALFASRMETFFDQLEVVDYQAGCVTPREGSFLCPVHYHYRHKRSGMEIYGTMRHMWRVSKGQVLRFQVVHDAKRMGAFFELTESVV